jgi:hypothetical protein
VCDLPSGALVVLTAVLTLLANLLLPLVVIRAIWNILFGLLLLFVQLEWKTVISRNFGFLNHWFMRSWFYLFVGTNVMQWGEGEQRGQDILSMVRLPPRPIPPAPSQRPHPAATAS